jgi:hypothetical protein
LGSEGSHCDRPVSIFGAFLEALDEYACGAFADVVGRIAQEQVYGPTILGFLRALASSDESVQKEIVVAAIYS